MRVLVTGGSGQVGCDLVAHCSAAGDEVIAPTRDLLDITRRDSVFSAITSVRPDVVVNCAAWTAVDACESDHDRAYSTNALAVRWIREACESSGAHLVHLSTDYVFDGERAEPYREWDRPDPRSVYGRSKLAGEHEAGPSATVVRSSWICGASGNNMVRTVLRLVETHDRLSFVDDQRGCPTFSADLAPVLRRLAVERRSGIHHVTNAGAVSWYEFVVAIVTAVGLDPQMVQAIATADLQPPRPAPRPANGVLDNAVLRLAGMEPMRHFAEPLAELIAVLGGR